MVPAIISSLQGINPFRGSMVMDRLAAMAVFVRVMETGSFSETARQLQIGQPAVSKTVAQLEDRLGVRLLLRSTRGLAPTDPGGTRPAGIRDLGPRQRHPAGPGPAHRAADHGRARLG